MCCLFDLSNAEAVGPQTTLGGAQLDTHTYYVFTKTQ